MRTTLLLSVLMLFQVSIFAQDAWTTYFEKSDGFETPRYDETMRYCKMLADSSGLITMRSFGTSPQGRELNYLIADKTGEDDPDVIHAQGKVILMVQACIHPGESEGKDAGMMLLRDIAIKKKHLELLDNVSILFIPIVNADGHERFGPYNRINQNGPKEMGWRTTATNLNLNRDFIKADAPEMKAWLKLYNEWLPDFFMDIHTSDGADYQYVITYGIENQGNMDAELTEWVDSTYLPQLHTQLEDAGFPVFRYVTFRQWHDPRSGLRTRPSSPRYSQSYSAHQNRPGLLVETHMLKPYKQRVEGSYETIVSTMRILNKDHRNLKMLNLLADEYCISGALRANEFPLNFRLSDTDSIMVDFRGVEYHAKQSKVTGQPMFFYSDTPAVFNLPMFNTALVDESVMLPEAYIIPVEWAEIIEILKLHGVEMTTLEKDSIFHIETYKFNNPQWARSSYEGRFQLNSFGMEVIEEDRLFYKGSVIISMNQRRARIIAMALEPKSPDAFIRWGFMNTIFERKEYAEGYVIEKMAPKMLEEDPELAKAFEEFKKEVPQSPETYWMYIMWFYHHSIYADPRKDIYPIGRL